MINKREFLFEFYLYFFLSKIFAMVGDKVGVSSYILYLSDHEEDVDIYGNATFIHGNTNKKQEYEIPFVLWLYLMLIIIEFWGKAISNGGTVYVRQFL